LGRRGSTLILYLDTSALVKLYLRERGSALVRRVVAEASVAATSVVAYAEARSAFARFLRERGGSAGWHRARVDRLDRDWEQYARVELTPAIARRSGELADEYALRGFDAIHLASALSLEPLAPDAMAFAAFDRRLAAAATAAGLAVIGAKPPSPRGRRVTRG
jgi:predicted nucleic acid-binding protein